MPSVLELPLELHVAQGDRWNIASEGKKFRCKMIEPGIVSYRDMPGGGIELLRKETIDRGLASALGNPLTINHVMVTAENRLEHENGIVETVEYDGTDGWFYCCGTVDTDSARARINEGWKPSCAYRVKSFGPGGVYHGIKYDREITEIEFNHLAIVERPRYEEATFRLNSLTVSKGNPMFKLLKKIVTSIKGADGVEKPATEVKASEVSGDTTVMVDGVPVRMNDLAHVWKTQAGQVFEASGDDCVVVDGTEVKMNDLVENYRKNGKKAETPEEKTARENAAKGETPEQKTARENSAAAETARLNAAAEEAKKVGTTSFFKLQAARQNQGADQQPVIVKGAARSGSVQDRLDAGRARYGSAAPGKN